MEHKSCLLVILYEFSIPAQQTIGRGQNYRREAPRDTQREVDEKIQGESSYSHRRRPDHGLPGQRIDKVREARLCCVAGYDAGEDRGTGQYIQRGQGPKLHKNILCQGFTICALMAGVMMEVRNKTWVKPTGPEEYKALTHQQNYSLPQGVPLLGSSDSSDSTK